MKRITHILLGLSLALAPACNVLEVEPVSDIQAESFFKNAGDAQAALMNCYNYVQNPVTQNFIIIPGAMSDEMAVRQGGNFTNHERFTAQAGQGNIGDMWREMYFAIHACNDVIDNVPRINDPALNKDQVVGEAYFLRGMSFFYLTRLYGKIPLVIQPSKSPSQEFNLPRNEVPEVFEQIIADLLQAENLLGASSTNRARASKGAARAMLAKVYLYRRSAGDYERALAETEEVMADNQYRLVPGANYADLFTVGKQNTPETIFELSYRPNTSVENQALDTETVPFTGASFRVAPEPRLITAFNANPGDLRRSVSIGTHNNQTYIRKYELTPPTTNVRGTQAANVIILRLADVILMRAECLNELGRTAEAVPFLNQIRTRAGLESTTATTQTEVRLAVENERYLELAFEGQRWFDLVRTGRAQALVPQLTNPDRILWPVPAREIDLNTNLLPQNPSY